MNISYLFRARRKGDFSIEELFHGIQTNLPTSIKWKNLTALSGLKQILLPLSLKANKNEVFHLTGDIYFSSLALPSANTVLTIHDIGHYERSLKGIKKLVYKFLWLKLPLVKARYITCISEFTKKRLVEQFRIPEENIQVIYNPYPSGFSFKPKLFNTHKPLILQVGKGSTKNRLGLIKAATGITCKLIFIGELSEEHRFLLEERKIEFENLRNLTFKEIQEQYERCDIVYFASFYEGFGLPIVEAQAIGRVVITSDVAAMPEVAGEGALLVDPNNIDHIHNAILLLIRDDNLRGRLIELGRLNIKRFEMTSIVAQYVELYKKVLNA